MPLSRTRTTALPLSCAAVSVMCPPGLVNFAALCRTLATTWPSRDGSPSTISGASGCNTMIE